MSTPSTSRTMESRPVHAATISVEATVGSAEISRQPTPIMSHTSDDSQTAEEFLRDQFQLEADAREAMPYSIDMCTNHLGPLRQNVFACLTCNPVKDGAEGQSADGPVAGVCYACSVQCHGEHKLVEIFQKRNFTCDCGTTRFKGASMACVLRPNPDTGKRGARNQSADVNNRYNQNFRNRFCGCSCDYDPFTQNGTMFQCLGLGTVAEGGCGEDWYHPSCLVGMGPRWFEDAKDRDEATIRLRKLATNEGLPSIAEEGVDVDSTDHDTGEPPLPSGFPAEDDFETFLCYKCIGAFPWIKRYAGMPGFLPPVYLSSKREMIDSGEKMESVKEPQTQSVKKRKTDDDVEADTDGLLEPTKRPRTQTEATTSHAAAIRDGLMKSDESDGAESNSETRCMLSSFPPMTTGTFSLFLKEDFREHLCRCAECLAQMAAHPQLLDVEETYEPPLSTEGDGDGGSTHGSGSLLERGESALRTMDRIQAIEGVMAYNQLKDRLQPFFREFAESGRAIGAEDIKAYFAKLRGDDEDIRSAAGLAAAAGTGNDWRREQGGY